MIRGMADAEVVRGLDPPASHRSVQVYVGLKQLRVRADQLQLRIEERLLGVGHLKIDRHALLITKDRQLAKALQRFDVLGLFSPDLLEFSAVNQGILEVLESIDDRLLVGVQGFALRGFGLLDLVLDSSCRKYRNRPGRSKRPRP